MLQMRSRRHVVAPPTRPPHWHPLALCAAADGSELIGSPRTNCATKKEQETQREEGGECCRLLSSCCNCHLLSLACVCLLSICGQCDRNARPHTHTHPHTHTQAHTLAPAHMCSAQLRKWVSYHKCFPFPGNQSDAIQLRPQPGHATLCVASRCLPNGRIPSKPAPSCAQLKRGAWQRCTQRRLKWKNGRNSACSFVRSAKHGRSYAFTTVIQKAMTVECYTRRVKAIIAQIQL